jgi:phosphopantothenoylcysteine decarboxylase/phosphopantothenate--cysteine ligase
MTYDGLLKNKKIAVFVTGSISAYKSLELVRMFVKYGAEVKVVMTASACKFITALSFEAISTNEVLLDTNESWSKEFNHISIGKWADIAVIAPASANTINALSNGLANNVLLSSLLAFNKRKIVAPAMNTKMLKNTITQTSIKFLSLSNYFFVPTVEKELICKDTGDGALADVEDIFLYTARELLKEDFYEYRKIIVSGGGSIEDIDDVRYISNNSSGKMGYALSLAFFLKGADVCFINTRGIKSNLFYTVNTTSSKDMKQYLDDAILYAKKPNIIKPTLENELHEPLSVHKKPFLFMNSAVSDYIPQYPQKGKMKKEHLGDEYSLKLIKNIDILKSLDKRNIYSIGFKAELEEEFAFKRASDMQKEKDLTAVLLNVLKDKNSFGSESMAMQLTSTLNPFFFFFYNCCILDLNWWFKHYIL